MPISPTLILLSVANIVLVVSTIILIRNRYELTPVQSYEQSANEEKLISVCIPARNEEMNIGYLLDSVLKQSRDNFNVLVLDDNSEDATPDILNTYKKKFGHRLKIISGQPKPDNWLGKPWACHQLGEAADGDILLFLDADTRVTPQFLNHIDGAMRNFKLDMLTVWPQQIVGTFWEKTVIPMVYYTLLSYLPVIYVYRKPRWMPELLYNALAGHFAAANGQCIALTRKAYQQIGGHETVKSRVVEDVELARIIKKSGYTLRMFSGLKSISCRMYRGQKEMFSGFRKNFLAGFGNSVTLFLIAAIFHIVIYLFPFAALLGSLFTASFIILLISAFAIFLISLQRLILSAWFQWDPLYAFTHPLGVIWFQWLGIVKLYDRFIGKEVHWKGRPV
jgi:chlorobactene glucosyltransferase